MKLIIVRHGDPDYDNDTLTKNGWKEAELLSEYLSKLPADEYYVSPLGRAKDTASCTTKKIGKEAVVLSWLEEFPARIVRPDRPDSKSICWDWLPQDWTEDDRFYSLDTWCDNDAMHTDNVREMYDNIINKFDEFIANHGYIRYGRLYHAKRPNNDTIVLFCHFGLECILLSRLLNISPMILWHSMCAAPSSVTTIVTEERRPGFATFRLLRFGDVSHLAANGVEPSFAARFCEKYGNENERID